VSRLENEIRELIIKQYGSVAELSRHVGIPATTLYNALSRGVDGVGSKTVLSICRALDIDANALEDGKIRSLDSMKGLTRLRIIREQQGISKGKISEELGMSVDYYTLFEESNIGKGDYDSVMRIASYLGVEPVDLIGAPYLLWGVESGAPESQDGTLLIIPPETYANQPLSKEATRDIGEKSIFTNYDIVAQLEKGEQNIIRNYRAINEEGQGLVTKYIEILVTHPDYSIEYHIVRIDETVEEGEIK